MLRIILLLPTLLLLLTAGPLRAQQAPALPYRPHAVSGAGGVMLSVQEWGNPSGPEVLFIHGGQQASLSWQRQVTDPALLAEFRMITFDLRGHGLSAKPEGDAHYRTAAPWADDVAAIISTLNLRRPTLVGWSFGGRVIGDYLTVHGAGGIAAIDFVAGVTSSDAANFGPGIAFLRPSISDDLATMLKASIDFARICFEVAPTQAEFETIVAYNMLTPRHVRVSMGGRRADYEAPLRSLAIPVLVTHGEADRVLLPSLSRYTASLVPGARLSLYPGVGHSPFWEAAPRFNGELAELVRRAN